MARVHGIASLLLAAAALACAGAPTPPPRTGAGDTADAQAYPGRCALLGVEQTTREGDSHTDSVELVARYQPDGEGPLPFGLAFHVQRERVDDLRAHLEQHPTVLCRPELGQGDREGDDGGGYELQLPPFEGQQGDYRAEPEPASGAEPLPVGTGE